MSALASPQVSRASSRHSQDKSATQLRLDHFDSYQSDSLKQMQSRLQDLATPPSLTETMPNLLRPSRSSSTSSSEASSQQPSSSPTDSVRSASADAPTYPEASHRSQMAFQIDSSPEGPGESPIFPSFLGHLPHADLRRKRALSENPPIRIKRRRAAASYLSAHSACSDASKSISPSSLTSPSQPRRIATSCEKPAALSTSSSSPPTSPFAVEATTVTSSPESSPAPTLAPISFLDEFVSVKRTTPDALPELRLLSATRTAPVGWCHSKASHAWPHAFEIFDQSGACLAPERQRFWPIVDSQLDYTGARMLSIAVAYTRSRESLASSSSCSSSRHASISSVADEPISPKTLFSPGSHCGHSSRDRRGADGSQHSRTVPHQQRRSPERSESLLSARSSANSFTSLGADQDGSLPRCTAPLSPKSTLASVIRFTKSQYRQSLREREDEAHSRLVQNQLQPLEDDEDGFSPSSLSGSCSTSPVCHGRGVGGPTPPDRCANLSIPTKPQQRDYFGDWQSYSVKSLPKFGKESTF